MLLSNTESEEGQESLEQAKGLLWPLQNELDRLIQNSVYAPYVKRKLGLVHDSLHENNSRKKFQVIYFFHEQCRVENNEYK